MSGKLASRVAYLPLEDSLLRVLLIYAEAADDDGRVWVSNATVAVRCFKSIRQAERHRRTLLEMGYLVETDERDGKTRQGRVMRVRLPDLEALRKHDRKRRQGVASGEIRPDEDLPERPSPDDGVSAESPSLDVGLSDLERPSPDDGVSGGKTVIQRQERPSSSDAERPSSSDAPKNKVLKDLKTNKEAPHMPNTQSHTLQRSTPHREPRDGQMSLSGMHMAPVKFHGNPAGQTFGEWRAALSEDDFRQWPPFAEACRVLELDDALLMAAFHRFATYHTDSKPNKRRKDWRRAFLNCIKGDGYGAWYRGDDGRAQLTTKGKSALALAQAQRAKGAA